MELNIDNLLRNFNELQEKRQTFFKEDREIIEVRSLCTTIARLHSKFLLACVFYHIAKELDKPEYQSQEYERLRWTANYLFQNAVM